MSSEAVVSVAAIIVLLIVFLILTAITYLIFNGKTSNTACKAFAGNPFLSFGLPFTSFRFSPFTFVCDIVAKR
jgi:hypothetical protein